MTLANAMLRLAKSVMGDGGAEFATAFQARGQAQAAAPMLEFAPAGRPGALQHQSWIDDLLIIRAFMLRELRVRYQFNPMGFLMEMLRPTIVIGAHYVFFLFSPRTIPAGVPLEVFVLGGFTAWFCFQTTYNAMLHAIVSPSYCRLPGLTKMHIRLSRAGFNLIINIMFIYIVVFLLKILGDKIHFPDIALMVFVMISLTAMGFGIGLFMESLARALPVLDPIAHMMTWGFYITSGMYGCVSMSTGILTPYYLANPVLNMIEYARHAMDPAYPIALVSMTYFLWWTGISLVAGLLVSHALRRVEHK